MVHAERRFPPPWKVHEATESFCIRDANGQALAYVYFEDEKGQRMAKVHHWRRCVGRAAIGHHGVAAATARAALLKSAPVVV